MPALAIRGDISPEELRRPARRVREGRVSARMIAIAHALAGMERATAARLAGTDRQIRRDWGAATTPKGWPGCSTGRRRGASRS